MKLKNNEELSWSPIVANNSMNRKRVATGVNSYEKDLKIDITSYLKEIDSDEIVHWIDLCCGEGNALIEVASHFIQTNDKTKYKLEGIDLVGYFNQKIVEYEDIVKVSEMDLSNWQTSNQYDLITIVHGLHYVGDKLGLIRYAASKLKTKGLLIANIDINDIEIEGITKVRDAVLDYFRNEQIEYNSRTKIVKIQGYKEIKEVYQYLGGDDNAGSNYTGQNVVKSYYKSC